MMTYKDDEKEELEAVETVCRVKEEQEGGEASDDEEEECLLLINNNNETNEEKLSGQRNKKTIADYCYASNYALLVFIWITSAVLFYQLGQWKCRATHDPSPDHHNNAALPDESSFQVTVPTIHPTLVTNVSALVNEDELLNREKDGEENKENELIEETADDAQDDSEANASELPDDESLEEENNSLYSPHLPFGENRKEYRRVCAPVHSSELCLTLRFPFPFETQDPTYEYPHPVDERMYELEPQMHTVDGDELLACRKATVGTLDEQVMACLESFALAQNNPSKAVVAVWTRTKLKPARGETDFYGVHMSEEQGKRIDHYFDNHVVLVLGASPAPAVTDCLMALFGRCQGAGIKPISGLCEGHLLRERELGNAYTYGGIPDGNTFIGVMGYFPNDNYHGRYHSLSDKHILNIVQGPDFQRPNPQIKRKLSLIIEHPIAHVQNQNMIKEQWDAIETIQHGFPQQIMNMYTPEGRKILSDAGWEPGHVIAFDGIPQFNPTETGAYDWSQGTIATEELFIANNGYEGWIKDYGTKCRGPLPPQSMLKKVNDLARQGYQDAGLDPKFYGRTWEFANQFWFAVKGWTPTKGMDCTHAKQNGTGLSCVHRYLLQLMVDDHYESLDGRER